MAKMTVVFPDELVPILKAHAGEGKASEYITRAVRRAILEEELKVLNEFERLNPPDPEFYRYSDAIAEEVLFGDAE
ncbi:hypothetical protein AB0N05_13075 [Nocardia sp. NPDC051030]|uniref:hypothetical protein n=1 Tax=Nocardia sp. NPDC051030 TaxID=3155162 RepID=UPI0034289937